MLSKKSYIWCNIGKATLLVVVLLKHFYSSYNVADSKCYGLKIIGSMLFVSGNCQSNTGLLGHFVKCYSSDFVTL